MTNTSNQTTPERLQEGDAAPGFSLPNADGGTTALQDFEGQKVVIYFYPKANTPGCTTEACDFQDSLTALNDANIAVVGISPDEVPALEKFRDKHNLTFPLLSDPDKTTLSAYAAYGEKKNYGKIVHGVIRSTFVIDETGTIELAKYNVRASGHVARILKEIGLA